MAQVSQQASEGWTPLLRQFAERIGADYQSGALGFSVNDGPDIAVEPLENSQALALHADLGRLDPGADDSPSPFADLLAANAPRPGVRAPVLGIDPVAGSLVLFERLESPAGVPAEEFNARLMAFAESARMGEAPRGAQAGGNAEDENTFENVWADFLFAHGLRRAAPDSDLPGGTIALDDGGYLIIQPEPAAGTVLIKAVLTFMPLDELDDEPLFRRLLEAHLLGEATAGAAFAIDAADHALVAWRRLPLAGLDANGLGEALDTLATTASRFAAVLGITRPAAQMLPAPTLVSGPHAFA